MKTRKQLLEERASLLDRGEAILKAADEEQREYTAEEQAETDRILHAVSAIDADLQAMETRSAMADRFAAARSSVPTVADTTNSALARMHAGRTAAASPKEFENFGEFIYAVARRQNDPRLASLYHEGGGVELNAEGLRMDDGPSGGFALPPALHTGFMQVQAEGAVIRPRATVLPAGNIPDGAIQIPALDQDTASAPQNSFGGVQFSWIGEGGLKPTTDIKLRMIELQPYEIAAAIPVTDKLLRNWGAASALVQTQFRAAAVAAEDEAFFAGSGIAKPLGVTSSNCAATIGVARTTNGGIEYADLVTMISKMLARGAVPVWIANRTTMPKLMTIKDDNDNFIWAPNAREGVPANLLGYPLIFSERAPALNSKADIGLYDFSHYLIKDGSGPFFSSSEHVDFLNNKTWFKMFWNVDGQPWLKSSFTPQKGTALSPFVVLNAGA